LGEEKEGGTSSLFKSVGKKNLRLNKKGKERRRKDPFPRLRRKLEKKRPLKSTGGRGRKKKERAFPYS